MHIHTHKHTYIYKRSGDCNISIGILYTSLHVYIYNIVLLAKRRFFCLMFVYTVLRKFTSDFHRVNQTLTKRIFLHENAIIINCVLVRASIILFYSYYPFAL